MQVVHKSVAHEFANGKACTAYEYIMDETAINGAVIRLTGRYPDVGCVMNTRCKELVYIIKGTGKLIVSDTEHFLSEGDMVLINPNEKYFWEGSMLLLITSTPAWTVDQYRELP